MLVSQVNPLLSLAHILDRGLDVLVTQVTSVLHYILTPPCFDIVHEVLLGVVEEEVGAGVSFATTQLAKSRVFVTS